MAINLITKWAEKIDEKNYPLSVSAAGTNQNYSWDGAKTIKVTSIGTGTMADYDRTVGFGAVSAAQDLATVEQTLTLSKDRSFRIKLDRMDENESVVKGEEVLARQLREVTIPEIEAYRFNTMCKGLEAAHKITATADAYADFLTAQEKLDDVFAPAVGRVAYVAPGFLNKLKQNPAFIKSSELGQQMLIKGQIGEVDGVAIVKINKAWLTDSTDSYDLLIVDKNATVAPLKLASYEAIDHPDFDGKVFQGRFYYDAFVLNNKKKNLAAVKRP